MRDNLSNRVGRLISGTVNRIVDMAEGVSPDMVMEQALREMEKAIDDVRTELGRVIAETHLATNRLASENQKHEELGAKIKLALNEGREDLAEAAVSQVLDIEAQIPVLENTIAQAKAREVELEGFVAALKGRRAEMQEELQQYRRSVAEPAMIGEANPTAITGNRVEAAVGRAETAFNRVLENAGGMPGQSPDLKTAKQMAELEELAREQKIKDRLSQFRDGS
ncbi:PspA/IM30 family protein [Aestuariispira insulae]|uniref:Phage shock protein A (PspA) family protein n=1 Tax=Aestuariispira insulae TaxID=1461337 RepID=A0A3D9HX24_9PROT|nr:PspA/IM30 family protein [Aestuariispira insulae]RED53960.1 phage shock protein A (PspA) family protein [Aestuariispira insulae]